MRDDRYYTELWAVRRVLMNDLTLQSFFSIEKFG